MVNNYRRLHHVLFILGFLLLAAVTVYTILVYGKIDYEVPIHFNIFGKADAFGSKSTLVILLIIGWFLIAGMTVVGALPSVWNTGVKVTEKNREKVYSIIRTMLSILTFAIAAFFSCLIFCIAKGRDLPAAALPVFLIAVFATSTISVIRLVRNR